MWLYGIMIRTASRNKLVRKILRPTVQHCAMHSVKISRDNCSIIFNAPLGKDDVWGHYSNFFIESYQNHGNKVCCFSLQRQKLLDVHMIRYWYWPGSGTILVAPIMCTQHDFLGEVWKMKSEMQEWIWMHPNVTNFVPVKGTAVPSLSFDWNGVNIALLFAIEFGHCPDHLG